MKELENLNFDELDLELGTLLVARKPQNPIDMAFLTEGLNLEDLCELACETSGNTVQTIQTLIESVLTRYDHVFDDAARAALTAVAYVHVPELAEAAREV